MRRGCDPPLFVPRITKIVSAVVLSGGASQKQAHDSFQRRFPSAEPALSLPKGYGMLRDQGRGDGGLGVLREGGGCNPTP